MADYEYLIAQLNSIAEDPTKLDGDTQQRILDATMSYSTKLLTQPPKEQLGALNAPAVQIIDPGLLQNGSADMSTVAAPLQRESLFDNHEARTNDTRIVGFSRQLTGNLPPCFGPHAISAISNNLSHNWSTSFPDLSPSIADFVSPSFLNGSDQTPSLVDTTYDPFPLDPTTNLYGDFDTTVLLGSSPQSNTGPIGMDYDLNTDAFNSSPSASHMNHIGQNAWHPAPSPTDQSHAGSNSLNAWPARSGLDIDMDPFIVEPPAGTGPFSHRKEPLRLGDPERLAHRGRITPDVDLDPSSVSIASALVVASADPNRDLSRNDQQGLGRKLKATNSSSLSVRSIPAKTIRKANTLSSPRKPKSPEKRRQIAERRRKGACYLCSSDRHECTGPEGSCDRCTNIMGPFLANHICLTGLQIHRSKIHGRVLSVPHLVEEGPVRIARIFFRLMTGLAIQSLRKERWILSAYELQESAEAVGKPMAVSIFEAFPILPDIISTMDDIDTRAKELIIAESGTPESTMDSFLQAYCNGSRSLPMDNCADAVLRLVHLDSFQYSSITLAYAKSKSPLKNVCSNRLRSLRFALLLYTLAAEKITETEKDLLGMLDEQMRTFDCNRRHPNSVILGLCLRRLSLVYRRELSQNKFLESRYPKNTDFQGSADKVRRMYDGCILAYSRVYRKGESPYSADWRLEDHCTEFGDNPRLIEMFRRIMKAERKHYETFDEKDEDDRALKELFLRPRQRGKKSWSG